MNSRHLVAATLIALLLCAAAVCAQTPGVSADTSLETYKATLQRLSDQVGATSGDPVTVQKLRAEIPKALVVENHGQRFDLSMDWLNAALGNVVTAKAEAREQLVRDIQAQLARMVEQADAFGTPSGAAGAQARLNEILSRREFRQVRGPSASELLWLRITEWIVRTLARIFGAIPADSRIGEYLVWIAIAIGVAILAIWLKRVAARSRDELSSREVIPFAPSAKNWRKWLAEARAAAEGGDWRNAIHLAYWAGVSHLEESGAWVPDRARTPREYLRLLPSMGERRKALAALTGKFEVVWYGEGHAVPEDFTQALSQLELLGCR